MRLCNKVKMMIETRERRESFRPLIAVLIPILVICRTIFPSLLRRDVYKRYFTGRYIPAGALRRSYRSMCVSVSPMISIRIPVIYVQYPSFERDHPYYRVYISQCAAGRHEIALVIFLRCSAFTVLAGHRKEWRLRGAGEG